MVGGEGPLAGVQDPADAGFEAHREDSTDRQPRRSIQAAAGRGGSGGQGDARRGELAEGRLPVDGQRGGNSQAGNPTKGQVAEKSTGPRAPVS